MNEAPSVLTAAMMSADTVESVASLPSRWPSALIERDSEAMSDRTDEKQLMVYMPFSSFGWPASSNGVDSASNTLPSRSKSSINPVRSEEHTSELQSLMRISYAVFCLKKKNNQ